MKKSLSLFSTILLMCVSTIYGQTDIVTQKPNILIIICDDLNDSVEGMGGHAQAQTPNIDSFAKEAVSFENAQCATPLCAPSRASIWTGIYPHKSGIIGYQQNNYRWYQSPLLKDAKTMFEHFSDYGYEIYTTGKIFHNNHYLTEVLEKCNTEGAMGIKPSPGPFAWDGSKKRPYNTGHPNMKAPWGRNGFEAFGPLSMVPEIEADQENGIPGYQGWIDSGKPFKYISETERDSMVDEKSASWAAKKLKEKHNRPFFLTIGFVRPHSPWIVPDEYFERFPLDSIKLPPYIKNDILDCGPLSPGNPDMPDDFSTRWHRLQQAYPNNNGWKQWIRSYLASVAFVDDQIGKVLKALEESGQAEHTIVILTSDHGFHMGEKDILRKNTIWEESTRVPLLVKVPKNAKNRGAKIDRPVSLIDIYPTLTDLASIPNQPNINGNKLTLDGHSFISLLSNPKRKKWDGPDIALTSVTGNSEVGIGQIPPVEEQHYSIRSKDFRYCLWADGFEELYDHRIDPHEWTNIAKVRKYQSIKRNLRKMMWKEIRR